MKIPETADMGNAVQNLDQVPSQSGRIEVISSMGGIGPIFDCEWPPKTLQDLFHPTKIVPDPEFQPLDLESLKEMDERLKSEMT
jgi:hypothetical protein